LALDSQHLIVEAALQGVGLAYTTEFAVAPDVAAGRLIRVLEDWTPPYPGLSLYCPANRHKPAGLLAFIGVVREAMTAAQTRTLAASTGPAAGPPSAGRSRPTRRRR
jgi:DNA-binding transcriptional LysR family regulator